VKEQGKVFQADNDKDIMATIRIVELENKVDQLKKEREALVQAVIALVGR